MLEGVTGTSKKTVADLVIGEMAKEETIVVSKLVPHSREVHEDLFTRIIALLSESSFEETR